jgi:transposase
VEYAHVCESPIHARPPFTVPGSVIDDVDITDATFLVQAHTTDPCQCCPTCGRQSARVHSRYLRLVRDLPVADWSVHVRLRVRRFFCDTPGCPQRTFAERLPDLAPVRARRTSRLTQALCAIGGVAGGEAGARLATRLHLATSGDTLLRILRATPPPAVPSPTALGIDDFALRKGRVYGTILVGLERRRPIDLLPDLTVVARDRSPEYARAVSVGAPQATQVADRFHLLSSLGEAVERYVHRIRPELRHMLLAPGPAVPCAPAVLDAPPAPRYDPSPARRQVQAAKHAERLGRFQQVKAAQARGLSQRQIMRLTGLSRPTVRWWMAADVLPPERRGYRRGGKVDPYGPYLMQRLAEGCTNQTRLWQEITTQGFVGTRSLVAKWIRAHRPSCPTPGAAPAPRLPGPQALAWLVLRATGDGLAEAAEEDRALWECLRQDEELASVQGRAAAFAMMVRERRVGAFDQWLADCRTGPVPELRNFAVGLEKDGAAVRAALALPWSNGPTEGQINKLKLIKRAAFGRMKLDLLRQRVLHAA